MDPETAYRYAQGQPVIHPFHRARVQLETPLDFLVVSDHAEFLGGIRQVHKYGVDTTGMGPLDKLIAWGAEKMFRYALADGHGMDMFASFSAKPMDPRAGAAQLAAEKMYTLPGQAQIVASAWREEAQTADAYNRPGEFSAIIGWEWTSTPGGANLHRIIFTDGNADSCRHLHSLFPRRQPLPGGPVAVAGADQRGDGRPFRCHTPQLEHLQGLYVSP